MLDENQAEKCCIHCKSSENGKKKNFRPLTSCALRLTSLVIHCTYKGQTFFVTMRAYWVSKDAEFYVEFKNINFS
jgi:hypothetical protein